MKRVLLLPILAMGLMVSQALAASAECTGGNKTINYLCAWNANAPTPSLTTNCWKLDADPDESETCASRAGDCGDGLRQISATDLATLTQSSTGYDCTNSKFSTVSGTPSFDGLENVGEGECKNGGTKQVFCQQTWGCMALDTRYSSIGEGASATCSPTGTRCTCSQLISNCPAGKLYTDVNKGASDFNNGTNKQCTDYSGVAVGGGSTPSSSSTGGNQPNSSSGGNQPSSSSGGNNTPIISHNSAPVVGLNVVSFARSLKVASGKDATVSLFDIHGKQVFGQKVFSGTTIISLEGQKQGVYYAVVKSGAQKQTVKVVLK